MEINIDVLVNNAAFQMSHKKVNEITTEEFDRAFRTNVYATSSCARRPWPT